MSSTRNESWTGSVRRLEPFDFVWKMGLLLSGLRFCSCVHMLILWRFPPVQEQLSLTFFPMSVAHTATLSAIFFNIFLATKKKKDMAGCQGRMFKLNNQSCNIDLEETRSVDCSVVAEFQTTIVFERNIWSYWCCWFRKLVASNFRTVNSEEEKGELVAYKSIAAILLSWRRGPCVAFKKQAERRRTRGKKKREGFEPTTVLGTDRSYFESKRNQTELRMRRLGPLGHLFWSMCCVCFLGQEF